MQKGIMHRLQTVLLCCVLAALLAGCNGSREAGLAGTWKVDAAAMTKAMDAAGTSSDPKQKMGMDMAKQMLANASLELKADKNFVLNMGAAMEGTWAFDDAASTVALTMVKVAGMDISKMPGAAKNNKPLVCSLSADGKQLSVQEPSGKSTPGGAMTFTKQ